ncbi:MAG: hypothetical protein ABSH46_15745 [Bryobacteraceae bacterium]
MSIIAFGAEHLICAHSREAVMPVIPFVPPYPVLAYLLGLVLIAAGLSIAANLRARLAATLFGALFVLCVLAFHVARVAAHPLDIGIRTTFFETLALGGAALALAGVRVGRYLFAVSSVVFGIDHFLILGFIASLVPGWIPGGSFWAWFTGAGFIAAGVAIAANRMARWGAFLLGTMFALWFLALHAPRILGLAKIAGAPRNPHEWSSAFIALAMCGGAWILAEAAGLPDLRHGLFRPSAP